MAIKQVSIGSAKNVFTYDDAVNPNGVETDGTIVASAFNTGLGISGTYQFNISGAASGNVSTMTFTNGELTGVTTVP